MLLASNDGPKHVFIYSAIYIHVHAFTCTPLLRCIEDLSTMCTARVWVRLLKHCGLLASHRFVSVQHLQGKTQRVSGLTNKQDLLLQICKKLSQRAYFYNFYLAYEVNSWFTDFIRSVQENFVALKLHQFSIRFETAPGVAATNSRWNRRWFTRAMLKLQLGARQNLLWVAR